MNTIIKSLLCLLLLFGLAGCKIKLNIFSDDEDDAVVATSGHFDCSNNTDPNAPDNGDCVQEYQANIEDCDGYVLGGNDTWAELPNCTEVALTATYDETLLAVPAEGNTFDGWDNFCLQGASACNLTVNGDAGVESEAIVEAHFGSTATPQEALYTYNHKGQRASKTVGNVTIYFIYDLDGHLIGEYDQNGNPLREYVYLEGQLLAQYDYVPSPTAPVQHYYINDHLGTPVYMINRDMDPSYELATGPFGEGYGEFKLAGIMQPVRFPGQYGDEETGYSDNGWRAYDPSIGRYLQPDPIGLNGGDVNIYSYVGQNPVMFIDPWGLDSFLVSRPLAATKKASHNYVASNANYVGDPNATIHSYGQNNNGNTGKVDSNTNGWSATTYEDDKKYWQNLACEIDGSDSTTQIPASDDRVDDYANSVQEDTDYAAFAGPFGTNSNSAASAVANAAAGTKVPVPNSGRSSPGVENSGKIKFSGK